MTILENKFKELNKDCYIPEDFSQIHREFAELPEYLRRWCHYRYEIILKEKRK